MYPVGHVALACGIVWAGARELERRNGGATVASSALKALDYRFVAFGALLPDIVDKPLVWWLLQDPNAHGHHIAHSVLVSAALMMAGAFLLSRFADSRLLLLAVGHLSHVLSDSVTHVPRSLFWPLVGLDVPSSHLFLRSTNVGGEIIGSLIVLVLAWSLYKSGRLDALLWRGRLP